MRRTAERPPLSRAEAATLAHRRPPGQRRAAEPRFEIVKRFDHPLLPRYAAFMAENAIHVAGIEFITDRLGRAWTYDVNTSTNGNPDAERAAGLYGLRALAAYLGEELERAYGAAAA